MDDAKREKDETLRAIEEAADELRHMPLVYQNAMAKRLERAAQVVRRLYDTEVGHGK